MGRPPGSGYLYGRRRKKKEEPDTPQTPSGPMNWVLVPYDPSLRRELAPNERYDWEVYDKANPDPFLTDLRPFSKVEKMNR